MTESEGRALARTTAALLVAAAARWGMSASQGAPLLPADSAVALPGLLQESLREKEEEARRRAPLAEGETLDPNLAGEADLDRLPGVGPAAARAIVAARGERGGFRRAEDLLEVRGIGPATLERMRPYLALPAAATPRATGGAPVAAAGAAAPLDLNRATKAELEALPGVGPALAARILEERERRGAFAAVDELLSVRGIGPATLERLRSQVTVR